MDAEIVLLLLLLLVDSITRYVLMWSIYGRFIYCARKFCGNWHKLIWKHVGKF